MLVRLQNSPYFCVFKYARAVKQKVWNETLTPRFTDFFTDFEKKTDCIAVYVLVSSKNISLFSSKAVRQTKATRWERRWEEGGGGVEYGCHYPKVTLRFFENDSNLTQSSPSVPSFFAKTHFTTEFGCYGYKIH